MPYHYGDAVIRFAEQGPEVYVPCIEGRHCDCPVSQLGLPPAGPCCCDCHDARRPPPC